jgi:hypothetical protein
VLIESDGMTPEQVRDFIVARVEAAGACPQGSRDPE